MSLQDGFAAQTAWSSEIEECWRFGAGDGADLELRVDDALAVGIDRIRSDGQIILVKRRRVLHSPMRPFRERQSPDVVRVGRPITVGHHGYSVVHLRGGEQALFERRALKGRRVGSARCQNAHRFVIGQLA